MKNLRITTIGMIVSLLIGFYLNTLLANESANSFTPKTKSPKQNSMNLGAFSISLSVKDLKTSQSFYQKLGFTPFAGSLEQNYLIMKNDNALIGLFEGMFQGNILTFNPGWDENANNLEKFDDIRKIQEQLINSGLELTSQVAENTQGPASLSLTDPDGNVILLDQHR